MTSHYDKYCEAISKFDADEAAIHYVNWQSEHYTSPQENIEEAANKIIAINKEFAKGDYKPDWEKLIEGYLDIIEENALQLELPDHLDPDKVAAAVEKSMEIEKQKQAATKLLWTYKPDEPVFVSGHNVADGESGSLWKFYNLELYIETEEQFNALTTQLKKDPEFNLTWLLDKYEIGVENYEYHWEKDCWESDGDYLYGTWDLAKNFG